MRKPGMPDQPVHGVAVRTTTLNSRGQEVAAEDRSERTDGWEIRAFYGRPVAINDRIYMITMLGIPYVIDSKAPVR